MRTGGDVEDAGRCIQSEAPKMETTQLQTTAENSKQQFLRTPIKWQFRSRPFEVGPGPSMKNPYVLEKMIILPSPARKRRMY